MRRGMRWLAVGLAVSTLQAPLGAGQQKDMAVGDAIPAFEAEGLDGTTREISFTGKSTVLLFFLSSCPTCHKMIPEWNKAYEGRPAGLQVVAVMLDREHPEFFMRYDLRFPIVRSPSREFVAGLGVQKVPMTVRVGPDGKVVDIGRSLLDPERVAELFRP